jgi:hypothetical protein
MNIGKIEECFYTEDAIAQAHEAELAAYKAGNIELADAYSLIADLLVYKLRAENDKD